MSEEPGAWVERHRALMVEFDGEREAIRVYIGVALTEADLAAWEEALVTAQVNSRGIEVIVLGPPVTFSARAEIPREGLTAGSADARHAPATRQVLRFGADDLRDAIAARAPPC